MSTFPSCRSKAAHRIPASIHAPAAMPAALAVSLPRNRQIAEHKFFEK
jgi:hypothetical protein